MSLFDPFDLSDLRLSNRIVMAPMTRSRNADTIADERNALYYAQRATAALIITEGTTVSPEAQGSIMVPGIWSKEQVAGWSKTTRAVHSAGGRIFAQLWHVGRMSHSSVQPDRSPPVSASAVPVTPHPMNTAFIYLEDGTPGRAHPTPPRSLTTNEVGRLVTDFVKAAENAITAGFDGVEIHGANGYLFEQFLNPHVNRRTDRYGGSVENRARLVLEVVDAIAARIGAGKVGVRLSPHSTLFDMPGYDENDATYLYLARELGERRIAFVHLHDLGGLLNGGLPFIPDNQLHDLKSAFGGPVVLAGGLTKARSMDLLGRGLVDLVAFGRPYIANPDLVERFRRDIALTADDPTTYYGGDSRGYTDYPIAACSG